jgi:hypothetical protein
MAVIAYPDNFNEIINLVIRLNNSFKRLEHAQEKLDKEIRNPNYKKKKNLDTMDWQANNAFKKKKKANLKKEKEGSHKVILNTLIIASRGIMPRITTRN